MQLAESIVCFNTKGKGVLNFIHRDGGLFYMNTSV